MKMKMEVDERRLLSALRHLRPDTFSWAFIDLSAAWWLCGGTDSICRVLVELVNSIGLLSGKMLSTVFTKKKVEFVSLWKACKISCQYSLYLMALRSKRCNNNNNNDNNNKVSLKAGTLDRKLKMKYFQFVGLCLSTVCLARLCQPLFLLQSLL